MSWDKLWEMLVLTYNFVSLPDRFLLAKIESFSHRIQDYVGWNNFTIARILCLMWAGCVTMMNDLWIFWEADGSGEYQFGLPLIVAVHFLASFFWEKEYDCHGIDNIGRSYFSGRRYVWNRLSYCRQMDGYGRQ